MVTWRTKIRAISLVGIASLTITPRRESGTARRTEIVIVIWTMVVTGIATETGRRNGIETGIGTETESEIERGNETGIVAVVMTKIVTGILERNTTILLTAVCRSVLT